MSKAEGKRLLAEAKRNGSKYGIESIESDSYADYLASSIAEAEADPENHNLVRTKSEAMRAAKDFIIDLKYDIGRNLDVSDHTSVPHYLPPSYGISEQDIRDAFWEGLHAALDKKTVQSWLADEILFRSKEYSQS